MYSVANLPDPSPESGDTSTKLLFRGDESPVPSDTLLGNAESSDPDVPIS